MSDIKTDPLQVLQFVYDDVNKALKTTGGGGGGSSTEVIISHADDSIKIGNGTYFLEINSDGSIKLPSGVATSAKQDTGNTSLANIETKLATSSSAALSSVTSATSSAVALASNSNRKGFILVNDSTATCYIAFAATASSSAYSVKLLADSTYESAFPAYTGVVSVIWASANGSLRVTELS